MEQEKSNDDKENNKNSYCFRPNFYVILTWLHSIHLIGIAIFCTIMTGLPIFIKVKKIFYFSDFAVSSFGYFYLYIRSRLLQDVLH